MINATIYKQESYCTRKNYSRPLAVFNYAQEVHQNCFRKNWQSNMYYLKLTH